MSIGNCLKHGSYYPHGTATAADCPRCRIERRLAEATLPTKEPAPTLTPEVQAVLEKAAAWRSGRDLMIVRAEGSGAEQLFEAVDAWQATLPPKDYAPEELKPGTRFRFVLGGCEGTIMRMAHTEWLYWADDSGFLHKFADNVRLIPLPDQDA